MARRKGKLKIHRKEWPRVREVTFKGSLFYSVDARKTGTNGKQVSFSDLEKALEHASTLAEEQIRSGSESTGISTRLRVMALQCDAMLAPFNKTIFQATEHYIAHLEEVHARLNSKPLADSLDEWLKTKTDNTEKKRAERTILELTNITNRLKRTFPFARVAEIEPSDIRGLLAADYEQQTRKNILGKVNQFFRWTLKAGYRQKNPCESIMIHVPKREHIPALGADEATTLMRLCESTYPDLLPYISVCLFGGLRPNSEAIGLSWDNIYLDTTPQQIRVLGSTSKIRETRLFAIESNLASWLTHYRGKQSGLLAPKNLRYLSERLRMALGYKLRGKNKDGPKWDTDLLRHTYATFWLAKYQNRNELAERMGTSVKMIGSHYKNIVRPDEVTKFWNIVPKALADLQTAKEQQAEEMNQQILQHRRIT
jgi:site-specific recombinase XerC